MTDELVRVLKLVEQGKLTAKQAQDILEALNLPQGGSARTGKRFLRIHVAEPEGNNNLRIALPLGLVRIARKFIPAAKLKHMQDNGIDLDDILACVQDETHGELVNVQGSGGESIRIWVE